MWTARSILINNHWECQHKLKNQLNIQSCRISVQRFLIQPLALQFPLKAAFSRPLHVNLTRERKEQGGSSAFWSPAICYAGNGFISLFMRAGEMSGELFGGSCVKQRKFHEAWMRHHSSGNCVAHSWSERLRRLHACANRTWILWIFTCPIDEIDYKKIYEIYLANGKIKAIIWVWFTLRGLRISWKLQVTNSFFFVKNGVSIGTQCHDDCLTCSSMDC